MAVNKCPSCRKTYDDEFRSTICPHATFAANDGNNAFRHKIESTGPRSEGVPCPKCGEQLIMGYGMAGGGFGPYTACPAGCAEGFSKFQDPDGR